MFGKRRRAPTRFAAFSAKGNPNLEDLRSTVMRANFLMLNARACAHDLYVTGLGLAPVAEAAPVRDHTLPNVSDDFHVCMAVHRKARTGRDLTIIPDKQVADGLVCRIAAPEYGQMVQRFQGPDVAITEFHLAAMLDQCPGPGPPALGAVTQG